METEGSLPYAQQPVIYSESWYRWIQSALKLHFIIIVPSTSRYSKLSLSFSLTVTQNLLTVFFPNRRVPHVQPIKCFVNSLPACYVHTQHSYDCTEHGSCYGIYRRILAVYATKLPCSETRQKGHCLLRHISASFLGKLVVKSEFNDIYCYF